MRAKAADDRASSSGPIQINRTRPAQSGKRFEFIRFEQISFETAPDYLVKGPLPSEGLAVVWGPAKCGKSFFVLDLLMHVALGWRYRGRRVRPAVVIYCALEGSRGFKKRVAAFRLDKMSEGSEQIPFVLAPTPLSLVKDHQAFAAAVREHLGGDLPGCIVIDTVNRSLAGSESSDADMGDYIKAADAVRHAFSCLVLVVHHCGIDATRMRGHTSLTGAVDAQIAVAKNDGGIITASLEHNKDGPSGEIISSRLRQVEIGTDDDGDPITSLVIDAAESSGERPTAKKPLSDRNRLSLDILTDCVLSFGSPLPAIHGIPGDPRAVKVREWQEQLYVRGVLDRDAKGPREEFRRVKNALLAKHLAGERDGLIWPA